MKKIILFFLFLLVFAQTSYGANVEIAGWSHDAVSYTATSTSDAADTTIWTPSSGRKIVLMGVVYSSGSASSLLLEQSSTAVIPTIYNTVSGSIVIGNGLPIWEGNADEVLSYTTSVNAGDSTSKKTHSILVWGFEED